MSHIATPVRHPWLSRFHTAFLALCTILFAYLLLRYPPVILHVAREAFALWWHELFPLLLPFGILSAIIWSGTAWFKVPQTLTLPTSLYFALITLLFDASLLTTKVRTWRNTMHLTRTESESLLCLCSTSSIYYVAIVLVLALLQKPALLLPLLLSHGLTTVCLAVTLRHQLPAWKALPVGDSVPLGARLNASVRLATQTNLQLAGWLILASIAGAFAFAFPLPYDYAWFGLIDPALGASALAKSVIAHDIAQQVVVVLSAVIGFGGLTNLLRLTSDSNHSDIRLTRIFCFKLAHALGNAVGCSLLFLILQTQSLFDFRWH